MEVMNKRYVDHLPEFTKEATWKGKYQSTDNTTIAKERGFSYQKNEEIS